MAIHWLQQQVRPGGGYPVKGAHRSEGRTSIAISGICARAGRATAFFPLFPTCIAQYKKRTRMKRARVFSAESQAMAIFLNEQNCISNEIFIEKVL